MEVKKNKQLAVKGSECLTELTPKKREFIELYRETHSNITECASAIGISRQTYYDWLEKDKNFALAIANAEAETNDYMKQALIERAGEGDMTAIIFWLKNRHPEFKQQSQQINISGEKVIAILGGASHALPEDNSNQQDTEANKEN